MNLLNENLWDWKQTDFAVENSTCNYVAFSGFQTPNLDSTTWIKTISF